jgi:hypothetical protein
LDVRYTVVAIPYGGSAMSITIPKPKLSAEVLAERKKAQIRARAEREIAEVDHDMKDLARLTAKYGLGVVERPQEEDTSPEAPTAANGADSTPQISITKASINEAEAMIRERREPVPLAMIFARLTDKKIVFNSKDPRSTLSAVLGQSGKLESIPGRGWWLKGAPVPPEQQEAH